LHVRTQAVYANPTGPAWVFNAGTPQIYLKAKTVHSLQYGYLPLEVSVFYYNPF